MAEDTDRQPEAGALAARRSVGVQAVLLVGGTAIAQVTTALIYLVGARSVSPSDFGAIVSGIALGTAGVGFFDFGSNSLWVRELANGRMSIAELRARASSKVLVAIAVAGAWAVLSVFVLPGQTLWTAAPVALSVLVGQTVQVILRARARIEIVAASVVVDRLVAGILMVLLLVAGVPVGWWMWAMLTAGSIVGATFCWFLTDAPDRLRPLLRWRNPWRGSHYYGLSSLAVTGQSLDVPILAALGGSSAAGFYGAVNRWVQPLSMLANSFASVSIPYVARAADLREGWSHARKAAWLIILALIGAVGLIVAAPWAVSLLLGPEYQSSVGVLQVLAAAAIPGILNQPLATFMQAMRFDRIVSAIVAVAVGIQLALVALLASPLGAMGAALSLLVAQSMMCLALSLSLFIVGQRAR